MTPEQRAKRVILGIYGSKIDPIDSEPLEQTIANEIREAVEEATAGDPPRDPAPDAIVETPQ